MPVGLYDAIYANASCIEGGYDRYLTYAEQIQKTANPWSWLANCEDMYWGVRETINKIPLNAKARIVEIGCGMGYLTYALRAAGYNTHGIDLSNVAVTEAVKRFGKHYSVEDATESSIVGTADAVIALELIEHLPDPLSFLQGIRHAVRRDSALILTTPNRDTYPSDSVWNTDLPPVHFHWFSERGIQALGNLCGFNVAFADFTERNAKTNQFRWIAGSRYRAPRFDEAFRPLPSNATKATERLTIKRLAGAVVRRMQKKLEPMTANAGNRLSGRRSVALVALLTPS